MDPGMFSWSLESWTPVWFHWSLLKHIREYCCVFLWMFSVLKGDADAKTSPKRRWSAFCFGLPWKTAKPCRISSFFCESHPDTLQNSWTCVAVPCSKYVLKILSRLEWPMNLMAGVGCYKDSPLCFWGLWSMVNKSQRSWVHRLSALQFELG